MSNNEIYVDSDSLKNVIEINNNNARHYEELAKSHMNEAIRCLSNCGEYYSAIQRIKNDCELIRTYIDRDYLSEISAHVEDQENPHNVTAEQIGACLTSDLSAVASSGSYNDLSDKPSIPSAQVQSDWNQSDNMAVDYIKNKPTIPSSVTVDQIYDGTSANAQSGVAIASAGFLTGITSSDVTTALGYTPYNSTNPSGYITGITSSDVTTALGYTPYNSTNPNGYITGITSSDVTTALGYTPCQADLSNCTKPYVTESYGQFAVYGSWYRVWSDGFIEQGGSLKPSADNNALEIIFLKTYQGHPTVVTTASYYNGSYTANTSNCTNRSATLWSCTIGEISTFNFYVNRVGTNWIVNWYACGY